MPENSVRLQESSLEAENARLRALYENAVGNRERFGWTINHLLEADEAVRTIEEEAERLREALTFYADRRNHAGVGVSQVYRDAGRAARAAMGPCQRCLLYGDGFGQVKTGRTIGAQDGPYDEYVTCPDCRGSGVAR